jgi:hypothetical protein
MTVNFFELVFPYWNETVLSPPLEKYTLELS